jgi:hypothetical protein
VSKSTIHQAICYFNGSQLTKRCPGRPQNGLPPLQLALGSRRPIAPSPFDQVPISADPLFERRERVVKRFA